MKNQNQQKHDTGKYTENAQYYFHMILNPV